MDKIKSILSKATHYRKAAFFDILAYRFVNNKVTVSAASLTYFLILAIFPFLIALLNIVRFFDASLMNQIMGTFATLPEEVASLLSSFLEDLRTSSSVALLSISLAGSIYSASSGVKKVIQSINDSFRYAKSHSFIALILLSIVMTIALFVLILSIFVVQIIGNAFLTQIFGYLNLGSQMEKVIAIVMNLVPVLFMFIIFFALYRFAPNWPDKIKPRAKNIAISSGFATFGIIIFTLIFNIYVSNFSSYSATYGSLAGIIVFLVWLYLFGLIILLGGEINATLHQLDEEGVQWPREYTMIGGLVGSKKKI